MIGVASHNLFEVAWAFVAARDAGALARVDFEMLEGMAPAQARAVRARTGDLLMYAPVVERDDFDASIAYLSRRLDENTQPENFLRSLFTLRPDTPEWHAQETRFRRAVSARHDVSTTRLRGPLPFDAPFSNEPDSDFTIREVRHAALTSEPRAVNVVPVTTTSDIDAVVARADAAFGRWSRVAPHDRRTAIRRAADEMRRCRFETVAVMATETGKTIREADPR
jgi:RHH-type proline utilization regulon transcriptional repressor/proline dehydrogenase/delta 1-pyrroline-5-carboxylate dehydrogenase